MKDIQKVTKITHNELRAFSNGLEEVLDGFIENNVRITELYALSQEKFVFFPQKPLLISRNCRTWYRRLNKETFKYHTRMEMHLLLLDES